jgi:NADH-quinone oxidoreductase subunit N
MDFSLAILEIAVCGLGLALLLLDLWSPAEEKPRLGWVALVVLGLILLGSFLFTGTTTGLAFGGMYVLDGLALWFKRFFLISGILVVVMAMGSRDRPQQGITEYYSLITVALAGMMFAASVNDLCLLFVALELITVTFYILTAYLRRQLYSLEAGVKYLIMGAVASAFLVYGIALVYATTGSLSFPGVAARENDVLANPIFRIGVLMIVAGLGFKIAAVPFQAWVPDVYQGAPLPAMAFLAVGSKAAGFILLLRFLGTAVPQVLILWQTLWMALAAATILYGSLCALPQRNLKRLLAYSGIGHAGFMLLGIGLASQASVTALLFYLAAYLFALTAAVFVLSQIPSGLDDDELESLAGLHQRSPLLGASLAVAMVSLAGIPPLAGFMGKFLVFKAALARGMEDPHYYWLIAIALAGAVISLYYYLAVVRAVYWTTPSPATVDPIRLPPLAQFGLYSCLAGMIGLGLFPNPILQSAAQLFTNMASLR